jgi:hypothetical protein
MLQKVKDAKNSQGLKVPSPKGSGGMWPGALGCKSGSKVAHIILGYPEM